MTPFVYRSTLILLLISLFLSLAILWKQETLTKYSQPRIESKYQTLPKANSSASTNHGSTSEHLMEDGSMMDTPMDHEMHEQIKSSVIFGDTELQIANGDTKDWSDCTLEMNQTIVQAGYKYHHDVFQSQKTVSIPYSSFTREGQSFNSNASRPNNVMLMCGSQGNMMGWNFFSNR